MTEILTESFCERCGTRYTFESAAPKVRLRRAKVFGRGLKNFVLDDKTSLDEAMAAARSDTDREVTSSQLDAFHQTFNFCMVCRQYTCPNCWNEAEGRCLTCAPMAYPAAAAPSLVGTASVAGAPASATDLDALLNGTAPTNSLASAPTNGTATPVVPAAAAASSNGHAPEADEFDPIARLDALSAWPVPASEAAVPQAVAPDVSAPEAPPAPAAGMAPESVLAPESVAPEAVAPEMAVVDEPAPAVVPFETLAPEVAGPEPVAPEPAAAWPDAAPVAPVAEQAAEPQPTLEPALDVAPTAAPNETRTRSIDDIAPLIVAADTRAAEAPAPEPVAAEAPAPTPLAAEPQVAVPEAGEPIDRARRRLQRDRR